MRLFRSAAVFPLLWGSVCLAQPAPVILISIDTLRADHLGAYGYRKLRTPNIDSFAEGGTLFSAIQSQIPLTLPSHTSLFTSTYPFANGVEENARQVPAGAVTLASVLHGHGYKTAAFVGSVILDRRTGMGQGFDVYDSPFHPPDAAGENPYAVRVRRDGALVVRAARQWLDANRGQPVFAFLHFFDLHTPYSLAPASGALPETAGYDAELAYLDQLLGRLKQALVSGGWWDRSLVVLLSDHGESLGDHGESTHGYFAYQSTVWVPLIFHWPAAAGKRPARIPQPGGLIDVAPTVLESLGIPRPPSFQGENLLKPANRAVYSESVYARDAFHWAPLRSLRQGPWQYIGAPRPELYDLQADPREVQNIVSAHSADAAQLSQELQQLLARYTTPATRTVTQSNRRLESLGYTAAGPRPGDAQPAPDPKDRLREYTLFENALAALYGGHSAIAIARFHEVLRQDQRNSLARYYLGEAYARAGQPEKAIVEWTALLKTDPEYVPAEEALGQFWLGRKDFSRARGYFQQALAAVPDDLAALIGAAECEDRLGLGREAAAHRETACRIEPASVGCAKQ